MISRISILGLNWEIVRDQGKTFYIHRGTTIKTMKRSSHDYYYVAINACGSEMYRSYSFDDCLNVVSRIIIRDRARQRVGKASVFAFLG